MASWGLSRTFRAEIYILNESCLPYQVKKIHGPIILSPCIFWCQTTELPARSDFSIAIATVYWPVTARLKGYFGVFAALCADYGEHLAGGSIAAVSVAWCFSCLTARGAALGLIGIAPGLEKLLFLSAERKCRTAVGTLEGFVLKTHWMTSSLLYFS